MIDHLYLLNQRMLQAINRDLNTDVKKQTEKNNRKCENRMRNWLADKGISGRTNLRKPYKKKEVA